MDSTKFIARIYAPHTNESMWGGQQTFRYQFRASSGGRPNEFGSQAFVDGTAVVRCRTASGRVNECVVTRRQALCIISHEVRYDYADAPLLVIEHYGSAAGRAGAQFQRSVGILSVEWLTIQTIEVFDLQVSVIKEDDMGGILPGYSFADGAVAGVIIDRFLV